MMFILLKNKKNVKSVAGLRLQYYSQTESNYADG